jgi:hypothetical protein
MEKQLNLNKNIMHKIDVSNLAHEIIFQEKYLVVCGEMDPEGSLTREAVVRLNAMKDAAIYLDIWPQIEKEINIQKGLKKKQSINQYIFLNPVNKVKRIVS